MQLLSTARAHAQGTLKSTLFLVYLEGLALNSHWRAAHHPHSKESAQAPSPPFSLRDRVEVDGLASGTKDAASKNCSRVHTQGTLKSTLFLVYLEGLTSVQISPSLVWGQEHKRSRHGGLNLDLYQTSTARARQRSQGYCSLTGRRAGSGLVSNEQARPILKATGFQHAHGTTGRTSCHLWRNHYSKCAGSCSLTERRSGPGSCTRRCRRGSRAVDCVSTAGGR